MKVFLNIKVKGLPNFWERKLWQNEQFVEMNFIDSKISYSNIKTCHNLTSLEIQKLYNTHRYNKKTMIWQLTNITDRKKLIFDKYLYYNQNDGRRTPAHLMYTTRRRNVIRLAFQSFFEKEKRIHSCMKNKTELMPNRIKEVPLDLLFIEI